jgi:hypothetical protein
VITRTRQQSFSDADPSRRESQADRCLESGSLIRKRAIDRAIELIAGRGDDAQRPDAGRSATCETEPRQHVLAGENDEHSTGRVVQHSLLVWIAAKDGRPWRRNNRRQVNTWYTNYEHHMVAELQLLRQ